MSPQTVERLRVTMEQMQRLIRALDDLRDNVVPKDPNLFAAMSETPLEDVSRLRGEIHGYVHELAPSA